jgi:hypothetical protein
MRIYHEGMTSKLGTSGISELGLRLLKTSGPDGEELKLPCLIVWHGSREEVDQFLLAHAATPLWVLLIGSTPTDFDRTRPSSGHDPRIHGVKWGLGKIARDASWKTDHPMWIVNRLQAFIHVVQKTREEPPWHLLEPPLVPEHLLACLVAALGGMPAANLPPAWETGFGEEVSYLSQELARQGARTCTQAPSWSDRGDPQRLREFLTNAAVLRPAAEQP